MKKIFMGIVLATQLLFGCSKEMSESGGNTTGTGDNIPITFTLATPGSEGVIYPQSRATHDAPEYAIKQLTLLVYDATDDATPTYLRKHDLATDIDLVDNGNGTYTFSLEAPIADMNAKRKFVFIANDDASVAAVEVGSTEETLRTTSKASVELKDGSTADELAEEESGIVMSGKATSDGVNEVITITPGVKCEVKLTRIVARIDLQNNTPNMTLESAELIGSATQGYLFGQEPLSAPTEDRIKLGSNTAVDITEAHPVLGDGEPFEAKTFKKVFYMYERPNTTEDYAAVRITYRVNESKGTLEVPFIRTAEGGVQTPVDIERNHLYTIVLGNGKPVETNPVEFEIRDEDWNVVEMPEEIGPGDQLDPESQKKLNEGLKVYQLFTDYNVKSLDPVSKKVTFESTLSNSAATTSYFSYTWLSGQDAEGTTSANGVNETDLRNEIFTSDEVAGNFRIPTAGELALLVPMFTEKEKRPNIDGGTNNGLYYPWWNDNVVTNAGKYTVIEDPFVETIYLENGADFMQNVAGAAVSGISQMKVGTQVEEVIYPLDPGTDVYNVCPVYGLRFKGSDQYAAYRWETCKIAENPLERYLSVKIKALHPQDNKTTIDDVANDEKFWTEGSYIEFKFPASGWYDGQSAGTLNNRYDLGINGFVYSNTLKDNVNLYPQFLNLTLWDACVFYVSNYRLLPLRLVKAE